MSQENMEGLVKATKDQINYTMMMNQLLVQQIQLNKNMVNGFIMLGNVISKVTNSLKKMLDGFGTIIRELVHGSKAVKTFTNFKHVDKIVSTATNNITALARNTGEAAGVIGKFKEAVDITSPGTVEGGGGGQDFNFFKTLDTNLNDAFGGIFSEIKKASMIEKEKPFAFDVMGEESFSSKTIGSDITGKLAKGMGKIGKVMKPMGKGFAAMAPQMLAMTLILKPVMALLQGILEPFEPLIEMFGLLGELIGLILQPIIMEITNALMFLIMGGAELIPGLQQMALALFNFMTPIVEAINLMNTEGLSLGEAIVNVLAEAIGDLAEALFILMPQIHEIILVVLQELLTFLPTALDAIIPAVASAIASFMGSVARGGINAAWRSIQEAGASFWDAITFWN